MDDLEAKRKYWREKTARNRALKKELGIKPRPNSDEYKSKQKEYMRNKRAAAKIAGVVMPTDEWRFKNPEKNQQNQKRWAKENPEKLRLYARRRRARLIDQGIKPDKPYTEEQKDRKRSYMRERREKAEASGIKLSGDLWHKRNVEKHRMNGKKWRAANPEKTLEFARLSAKKRRETQWGKITNRLYGVMQVEIRQCSPWHSREGKYTRAMGYSWFDLYTHIEKQFRSGMSWDNWGEWHIDHIKPLKLFKYETLEDPLFKEAWALSNLQPLWKSENLRKSCKYDPSMLA